MFLWDEAPADEVVDIAESVATEHRSCARWLTWETLSTLSPTEAMLLMRGARVGYQDLVHLEAAGVHMMSPGNAPGAWWKLEVEHLGAVHWPPDGTPITTRMQLDREAHASRVVAAEVEDQVRAAHRRRDEQNRSEVEKAAYAWLNGQPLQWPTNEGFSFSGKPLTMEDLQKFIDEINAAGPPLSHFSVSGSGAARSEPHFAQFEMSDPNAKTMAEVEAEVLAKLLPPAEPSSVPRGPLTKFIPEVTVPKKAKK